MGWHGSRGNCGCCGGGCTCATTCECRDGSSGGPLLGYVSGHTLTLSGFPAVMEYRINPFPDVRLRVYGLDQFNGSHSVSANHPGCYGEEDLVSASVTAIDYPSGCAATGRLFLAYRFLDQSFLIQEDILNDPISDPFTGCGCKTGSGRIFRLPLSSLPSGKCANFPEGNSTNSFVLDCGLDPIGGYPLISASLTTNVSNSPNIPHVGWNYNVSNVPSSFYLRISNGVKSYQITGMNVLNGDYELELDDESDCSKSGIEFLTFDITAQEFQISTSSPCTIVPIGSTIAATARLALPPTSAGVVVTIRIPGENDKSILIDDWVPFGCESYEDDAYIDHELTECFGNPDPILTLSKTAILG